MNERNVQDELDDLQQKYASLVHEHEKLKHLLTVPDAELKLAIFDHLPMPVWACDRECRIVFWNEAAARIYCYSSDEAVGQDFVSLFVNEPEQGKARSDCVDIIDNNRPIKNMAEDRDKHGNTRRLVTQCFPLYNVAGHPGLQVEISYEVQDIERLQAELLTVQEAYERASKRGEELRLKLLDVTRERGLKALEFAFASGNEALRERRKALDRLAVEKDAVPQLIAKIKTEIKGDRERLVKWEREMRRELMSQATVEALESLILSIDRAEILDV
jgi:PAS domain S-box-containing protein